MLRESVIGRLAGGELLVAAALEVVNAFRRLDTDPGLARAAARVVRGFVSFGGRDYQAEAFTEWVRSLRTAVTTAVRFLREEEGLLPALSDALGGGLDLLEEVLNAADPAALADLAAATTVTLRRLARFLRGFAGDLDLEEALQQLAAAIGNHDPGRALRGVLLRSSSYLYFAVSFAWEVPPDEAGGWIRQEAAKLWPKLRGEAAQKAAERFVAALDGVGDEVQDFIGNADVAATVRVVAAALGDGPELWADILTGMNPFPEPPARAAAHIPPGFKTMPEELDGLAELI